jgi:ADP-ribose pyrophosphatase YjhB (NUDIX family)
MNLSELISGLDQKGIDPSEGLPDELFYFVSRMTPMVNVDLLIKDQQGRNLLAWREDEYAGAGWHLPGGIVRFRETIEERIMQVGLTEVGARVKFQPAPVAVNEVISKTRATRGHFISLLYSCELPQQFEIGSREAAHRIEGDLEWFPGVPDELLALHEIYRRFL